MAQYKTFIATTFQEAREKMFREMGTGAYMIEHGKVVKKKYFGLKKDVFYEIKAVVYNEKIPAQTEKKKKFPQ